MFLKSIKYQVLMVLAVQLILLLAIVLTSLSLLNRRQHDYLILNLTGQLRVITQTMVTQSSHYAEQAPRDYETYERDLGLFNKDLINHVNRFDAIIRSLKNRVIKADLVNPGFVNPPAATGPKVPPLVQQDEPLICTWDAQSRNQMNDTTIAWDVFHAGLRDALGSDADGPRLEAAAQYILLNEHKLTLSTAELASSFRRMMEYRLGQIRTLNQLSILLMVLISATIIVILYKRIFHPIQRTVEGFKRVSSGDLNHQVPVHNSQELGIMTSAFNYLTLRLSTLFRLTDKINQATSLDNTLQFAFEEFPVFLPLDWVGVLRTSHNSGNYHLDRAYAEKTINISDRETFTYSGSIFEQTILKDSPLSSGLEATKTFPWQSDAFVQRLNDNNLKSIFYMPLLSNEFEIAVIVFASTQIDSYTTEHMEFMTNIANQVAHSFEKTIGMESLVISTVEGLAKLAESRDPETGDHLFRMSHYSAIIAGQLATTTAYQNSITPAYIRDILQFAPMHDIGKVGVSDDVLLKPGRLDEIERKHMEQHPVIGGEVLRRCELQMNAVGHSVFKIGIEIAESHHEKFDGSGYPYGLVGDEIPLSARIIAVADVFDALTSKRPYKDAWSVDKAIDLLSEEAGKHFDPKIIQAFKDALPKIMQIYEQHKHV